jgi:polyribonucleotide nucleotidyltransferase
MRMIDRPLRPLFPEGYMAETIIMSQVLSFDGENDPQVLAGFHSCSSFNLRYPICKVQLDFVKLERLMDN